MTIVHVLSYHDDEQTMPAEYVQTVADGKFEAVGMEYFEPEARGQVSLGVYPTLNLALKAISRLRRRQDELMRRSSWMDCFKFWEPTGKPNS
jgi:hypothetical protein